MILVVSWDSLKKSKWNKNPVAKDLSQTGPAKKTKGFWGESSKAICDLFKFSNLTFYYDHLNEVSIFLLLIKAGLLLHLQFVWTPAIFIFSVFHLNTMVIFYVSDI